MLDGAGKVVVLLVSIVAIGQNGLTEAAETSSCKKEFLPVELTCPTKGSPLGTLVEMNCEGLATKIVVRRASTDPSAGEVLILDPKDHSYKVLVNFLKKEPRTALEKTQNSKIIESYEKLARKSCEGTPASRLIVGRMIADNRRTLNLP